MIEIKSISSILCLSFVYIRTQPILCVSGVITQAQLAYYYLWRHPIGGSTRSTMTHRTQKFLLRDWPLSYPNKDITHNWNKPWHHYDQVGIWYHLWSQHFWWRQPLGYPDVTCSLPTESKLWYHPYDIISLMRCMTSSALIYATQKLD